MKSKAIKLRIESGGEDFNTSVKTLDGEPLENVQSIHYDLEVDGCGRLTVTTLAAELLVTGTWVPEAEKDHWKKRAEDAEARIAQM